VKFWIYCNRGNSREDNGHSIMKIDCLTWLTKRFSVLTSPMDHCSTWSINPSSYNRAMIIRLVRICYFLDPRNYILNPRTADESKQASKLQNLWQLLVEQTPVNFSPEIAKI
jgi:hypothetical protein